MRKLITFVFFIFTVSCIFANNISVNSSSEKGITFEFGLPDYRIEPIEIDKKTYKNIAISDMGMLNDIGKPSLPVKYLYFAIPLETEDIRIQIVKRGKQKIENTRIIPVFQMALEGQKIEEDSRVYGRDVYFPGKDYEILFDGLLYHQRLVKLAIYPFQFQPISNKVVVYNSITVKVKFLNGKGKKGQYRFLGVPTERRLKKLLINYGDSQLWREEKIVTSTRQDYTPWYKIKLTEDGVYKIGYSDLKNYDINPDNIDPRTIKIYNGGSSVMDDDISNVPGISDTIPYQIPIYISGEGDGEFNEDDFILFYAISLTGWERCSVSINVPLYYNPFTDTNAYWLTFGENEGRRMEMINGIPSFNEPYTPSCFKKSLHIEENHLCPSNSGFGWVWEKIELPSNVGSMTRNYSLNGDNLYTDSFEVFTALYGAATGAHNVELQMNSLPFCDTSWGGMNYNAPYTWSSGGTNLLSGQNTLSLRLHKVGGEDGIYLDYFEVSYYKNFRASNNMLDFSVMEDEPSDTIYEFNLYNFSESPYIFDVTSPFETKMVTGGTFNSGTITFQVNIPNDEKKKFIATKFFKAPLTITVGNPYSLRTLDKADHIIITHKKFYYAALELANWRRGHLLGVQNPTVKILLIDELYNNFGCGLADPVAIRNFLYYASNYWEYPPGYVLLLGGGSYDYKNLFNSPEPKNFIPVYETGDYIHFQELMSNNPCYEDFFGDLTGDLLCDIPVGRLTVTTEEEAADVVNKIIKYESSNLGVWKNNFILLADDEFDYNGIDPLYRYHTSGTETISHLAPANFDQKKVYLSEYPGTNPGTVPPGNKPEARQAFIDVFDKGALMGIFLGHGNLRQLAHELVFYRADVGLLENNYRGPFFYFGSCSVGDFDRPDEESISDLLQKKGNRGAIASLGCTRTSGYSSITTLGMELTKNLLFNHNFTIGDGLLISKQNANFGKKYAFFGDPATPLFADSVGFQATFSNETLAGGSKIIIDGEMSLQGFNGFLFVSAFDPIRKIVHPVPNTSTILRYNLPGNTIYQGIFNITNGKIYAEFFVPTYFDTVSIDSTGRISMYIWNNEKEGRGSFDSLITGINADSLETISPTIELYYKGKLLEDSMSIPSNAEILGVLEDLSGIDITGRTNRSICLAINEDYTDIKKLNDFFSYDINSATRGSFQYALDLDTNLTTVRLEFSCYDNCSNRGEKVLDLNVYSGEEFTLNNVYNFPNPFKETTYFTFTLSHRSDVKLTIFTVTGKTIYKKDITCALGFTKIFWDGRDADGDRVANGLYFYKIEARAISDMISSNVGTKAEYRGKIAVAR